MYYVLIKGKHWINYQRKHGGTSVTSAQDSTDKAYHINISQTGKYAF